MLKHLKRCLEAEPAEVAEVAKPAEAQDLVIDVRSAGEYAAGHLEGSINVPLERIALDLPGLAPDKSQLIMLCCASGMRSGMALQTLQAMGYQAAVNGGGAGALALRLQRPIRRL